MNNKLINNLLYFKSFENILYEWLDDKKHNIKESSYNKYLYQIQKNIIPYFKNISIKKIDKWKVLDYFSNDSIICLSNSTKNNILIIINSTINYSYVPLSKTTLQEQVYSILKENKIYYNDSRIQIY